MSDGAQQGIGAERALGTILGGQPAPSEDEGMSREALEARIMVAPYPPESYDDAALYTAKFILTALRAHPEIQTAPVEDAYDFSGIELGQRMPDVIPLTQKGWPALLKEIDPAGYDAAVDEITGFMWGWATNAARYILDLPEVPNPAIITIGE